MRQIVLDTETTGLEPTQGHKIIEIGCVELFKRRKTNNNFHCYLNPDREIDEGALEVHGITSQFLQEKPRFVDVVDDFINYIKGAELVIHNAAFDVGFLDHELKLAGQISGRSLGKISDYCSVLDTLKVARKKHPGQKNNLNALCKRYGVDNSNRELHGALLDAEILADVYVVLTGGQAKLALSSDPQEIESGVSQIRRLSLQPGQLKIIQATEDELISHQKRLDAIDASSAGSIWRQL